MRALSCSLMILSLTFGPSSEVRASCEEVTPETESVWRLAKATLAAGEDGASSLERMIQENPRVARLCHSQRYDLPAVIASQAIAPELLIRLIRLVHQHAGVNRSSSAFAQAAGAHQFSLFPLLAGFGYDVNARDGEMRTALSSVAGNQNLASSRLNEGALQIEALQKLGGRIEVTGPKGQTALHAAAAARIPANILKLGELYPQALNQRDDSGRTPLIAMMLGHNGQFMQSLQAFLALGVDLNVRDSDGMTALGYLLRKGAPAPVIEDLRRSGATE